MLCYCKSGTNYTDCCESLLLGKKQAINCQQLMRSRFTAFAVGNTAYLISTSSTKLLTSLTKQDLLETCNAFKFVHLEIVNHDNKSVEFIAHLLMDNEHHKIHERSQFISEDNRLKYDSGDLFETPVIKLNRNDNCPCQSGKKFKKCHIK